MGNVSERITTQCSGKETYKWIETSSLYVPERNTQQHVLQSIPSALACITACEDRHRYCTAIMYDETNNECLWYEEPELLTYQRIRVSAPKLGLSKFCFPGDVFGQLISML